MTKTQLNGFRERLLDLGYRLNGDVAALADTALSPTGGQAAGNLSNAPQHLADLGTNVFDQELNMTLLENSQNIREEINDALNRLEAGTFGICENCQKPIAPARLEAIPYARYCVKCADVLKSGDVVNLNNGRPSGGLPAGTDVRPKQGGSTQDTVSPEILMTDLEQPDRGGPLQDIHAAGTPGGGSAVGGLAGTNIDEGAPTNANLEEALGSSNFDEKLEEDGATESTSYAGRSGGAVGGTPANKRSEVGHTRNDVQQS